MAPRADKNTNLVPKGKKVVVEQEGRECHPVVLRIQGPPELGGTDTILQSQFTFMEVLIAGMSLNVTVMGNIESEHVVSSLNELVQL